MHYDAVLGNYLWNQARTQTDRNVRGRLFEWLIGYLFESAGDYEVRTRIRGLASEHDLLLQSLAPDQRLHRELGSYVLVECKNKQTAVGSRDVKAFSANVRSASCRSGVLPTMSGITGGRGGGVQNAEYVMRTLYHRDGTILLVLDRAAIEAVISQRRSLQEVLTTAYEAIRFDLKL